MNRYRLSFKFKYRKHVYDIFPGEYAPAKPFGTPPQHIVSFSEEEANKIEDYLEFKGAEVKRTPYVGKEIIDFHNRMNIYFETDYGAKFFLQFDQEKFANTTTYRKPFLDLAIYKVMKECVHSDIHIPILYQDKKIYILSRNDWFTKKWRRYSEEGIFEGIFESQEEIVYKFKKLS